MAELSELQRIRQAIQGDRGVLGQLLRGYQPRLYNVVLRMVGNPDDAAELTQETMLRIIQHIGSYDGQAAFSTWAIRIAMNLSISHLRKRKVRSAYSLDTTLDTATTQGQATSLHQVIQDQREPKPDDRVQQEEMLGHLTTALGRIDAQLRAILVLRDLQEMDYAQIAQVLTVPLGTVKSRLFRARLALRREMYKLCPGRDQRCEPTARHATPTPGHEPAGPSQPDTEGSIEAKDRRPEFPAG